MVLTKSRQASRIRFWFVKPPSGTLIARPPSSTRPRSILWKPSFSIGSGPRSFLLSCRCWRPTPMATRRSSATRSIGISAAGRMTRHCKGCCGRFATMRDCQRTRARAACASAIRQRIGSFQLRPRGAGVRRDRDRRRRGEMDASGCHFRDRTNPCGRTFRGAHNVTSKQEMSVREARSPYAGTMTEEARESWTAD